MFFQKSFMTLGKALRQKFSEVLKHFSPIEGLHWFISVGFRVPLST